MKGGGGEIVQVQGGHIIRSTGRKDRHSKVYTAKGPRDRRVRLSAHTAIQFYDVQDRLGYDRPSKAVDWLIKKAKSAIDKLAELPPFDPSSINANAVDANMGSSSINIEDQSDSSGYAIQLQRHLGDNSPSNNEAYAPAPQSLDSQSIADTMKSFFPISSAANSIGFQDYDIRNSQSQDLCLSLHTFQDQNPSHNQSGDPTLLGFETNSGGWVEQQQQQQQPPDLGRFSRLLAWSTGSGSSLPMSQPQQGLFGQGGSFAQRGGALQSSYSPGVRAWDDLPEHHKAETMNHHHSGGDGFMGFCLPSQLHGEQQVHGAVSGKASLSMSPNSSH